MDELGPAGQEAHEAEPLAEHGLQRLGVALVAARDHDGVGVGASVICAAAPAKSSTITLSASGKRSLFANFTRSSATSTRNPADLAMRASGWATWPAPNRHSVGVPSIGSMNTSIRPPQMSPSSPAWSGVRS